jgi:hypothetical protein
MSKQELDSPTNNGGFSRRVDILPLTFDPSFSLRRIMSNGLLALLYLPVGTLLSTDGKMMTLKRHDESSDVTCNCFHLCYLSNPGVALIFCQQ